MKVKLTADDIRKIESAFEKDPAVVELKREQKQITVLAVRKQKITGNKENHTIS